MRFLFDYISRCIVDFKIDMKYVWKVVDTSDNEAYKDFGGGRSLRTFDTSQKAIKYVEDWIKGWIGDHRYRYVLREKTLNGKKVIVWRLEYLEDSLDGEQWIKEGYAGRVVRRVSVK
jgi:hypothetical protein